MLQYIRDRWFLFLVLVVFIFFKIPHLSYPFYWDESWPYATAVHHMYDHGVSLMPGAIPGELSRGHPLFFHAAATSWMHIFGTSNFSLHCYALFISVLFLIVIFEAGFKLFNKRVAAIALLLITLQVCFFVQSAFLLFDMLVAFLSFAAIYCYIRRKYILTIITLSALFYTKESGLIAGFVIGLDALISFFNKKETLKERIAKLAVVAIPTILIGIFFLLQKKILGWYVFPMYSGLIEHSWTNFWYRFRTGCVDVTFHKDYRYYFFLMVPILCIAAAIKNRSIRYLVLLIPMVLIYYWIDDTRAGRIPSRPTFMLFIAAVVYAVTQFKKLNFFKDERAYRFMLMLNFFLFCFLCFSAMNFLTYRYLLVAIVPALFIAAVYIDGLVRKLHKWIIYSVFAAILFFGYYSFAHDIGLGDCDLGAFHGMDVYKGLVAYLEQHSAYDKTISATNFQTREHLIDPYTGYLSSKKIFAKVQYGLDSNTNYIVFDNVEPDNNYDSLKKLNVLRRVYSIKNGTAWGEIYERVK